MNTVKFAEVLVKEKMLMFGKFTLSSGKSSFYYIDLRRLPGHKIFRDVVHAIIDLVSDIDYDMVVGVATGGIPLASYIACITGKPMGYVRVERKTYGTMRSVEADVSGRKILLVDDVATTGGSLYSSIRSIQDSGGHVATAVVIVDRCEGASERLRGLGVPYRSLYRVSDIFRAILDLGYIDRDFRGHIERFLAGGCDE